MNRWLVFLPFVLVLLLSAVFFNLLQTRKTTPAGILASELIDRPFVEFSLPDLNDQNRTRADVVNGEVTLVNVWGSWCRACLDEHPFFQKLKKQGVRIVGVNHRDTQQNATDWLDKYGEFAAFHIQDVDGRLGINLGVYGAPETYLLDKRGFIRFKQVGVLTEKIWTELEPLVAKLNNENRPNN